MDWDGIGTAALFLGAGGFGVALIALKAYKARLASKLEWERLRRSSPITEEALDQIQELENRLRGLGERVEFAEGLLGKGQSDRAPTGDVEQPVPSTPTT